MDNVEPIYLTRHGKVTISEAGIDVEGFDANLASCRELAVMAAVWAIGELQRELLLTIQRPGGGNISVD
ncbi:hypothetical protein [Pseudomonas phage PS-1]|uniref:hypothetical protein n=1 Tax=Pseudomonas phage PS-1 TaxID=1573458 RepID=UPI00065C206E|nr:hypothetical protein AXI79_gp22 [Pseudomonas phage PS-1]BAR92360.1 hypothetical protein [Pseudomonas phage PS-1]